MKAKDWIAREKYVALHAQTWKFRVVKYVVLFAIAWSIYEWKGWDAVGVTFLILFVVAIAVHFLFRWKSKAWTQSWGPYKKLDLPKTGQGK